MTITREFVHDPNLVLDLPLYKLDGEEFSSQDAYGLVFTNYGSLWTPHGRNFDGIDDYIYKSIPNFRSGDSAGAIEGWFRSSSVANNQTLVASGDTATTDYYISLYVGITTGLIIFNQVTVGVSSKVTGATNVCDGKWHYIVVSSSGTAWTILLDGVPEALTPTGGGNNGNWYADTANRDNLTIGAIVISSTASYTIGVIGWTRIYSRPMLQSEAQRRYLASKWRFQ